MSRARRARSWDTGLLASLFPIYVVKICPGGGDADPEVRRVQNGDNGGGHKCQKECLKDEHGEDSLVEDASRETNVENDQLHQPVNGIMGTNSRKEVNEVTILPFATHQRPDGCGFAPAEPGESCCDGASTELANVSRSADGDCVAPSDPRVE